MKYIKAKIKLVDDILTDFLKDLKSLRVWLIFFAFGFNVFLFINKADSTVMVSSISLLGYVYAKFFESKKNQAEYENRPVGDVIIPRSPD